LASGAIGCTGVPVRRCNASPPAEARIRSACTAARESAQVIAGVTGSPAGSSPITLCIAELKAIPATRPETWPATSRRHSSTASRISFGSCSAYPGWGSSSG
jgi:hypothetical protein